MVENGHCVLAMAQERRTSTAAYRHRVRDSFWKVWQIQKSLFTSPSIGLIPVCWSFSGIEWGQQSGNEQWSASSDGPWKPNFYHFLFFFSFGVHLFSWIVPHLSSWPCIQVEMKRQQESGHGMILYCPHHLKTSIKYIDHLCLATINLWSIWLISCLVLHILLRYQIMCCHILICDKKYFFTWLLQWRRKIQEQKWLE